MEHTIATMIVVAFETFVVSVTVLLLLPPNIEPQCLVLYLLSPRKKKKKHFCKFFIPIPFLWLCSFAIAISGFWQRFDFIPPRSARLLLFCIREVAWHNVQKVLKNQAKKVNFAQLFSKFLPQIFSAFLPLYGICIIVLKFPLSAPQQRRTVAVVAGLQCCCPCRCFVNYGFMYRSLRVFFLLLLLSEYFWQELCTFPVYYCLLSLLLLMQLLVSLHVSLHKSRRSFCVEFVFFFLHLLEIP